MFEFEPGQVEPPPRIGSMSQKDFIQGIGKRDDQFIILLDINRVFSTDEVVLLGAATDEDMAVAVEGEGFTEPTEEGVEC